MTLEETLNRYKQFGASDFDIIRLYFTNNKLEAEAVEMLTDLCKRTINKQHNYISTIKEFSVYAHAILYNNKIDLDVRKKLVALCQTFINNGELIPDDLEKANELLKDIKATDLEVCPIFFLGYLQNHGIGLQFRDCRNERSELIEEYAKDKLDTLNNVGISF